MDHLSERDRLPDDDGPSEVRAAVYARTSSTQQSFGHSLDEQVRLSIERCHTLGWEVVFIYRDEAESGKDPDRPMFQSMLSAAEMQAFNVIVFWKLDRFSRSLMHAVQLESELRQSHVGLYSITEQIDTTSAAGRFNFRNIASAAEFERDMIRQRTRMGLHALAAENKWPNDNPPLGYSIDCDGRLQIVEKDAELVRKIFSQYLEVRSMPEVAEWLNQSGSATRENNPWTPRAVGDILRNKIYYGYYELEGVSELVPEYRILDQDLFNEVKRVRHRYKSTGAVKGSMPTTRKGQTMDRMYQSYCDYLREND
ncbi:hypothetical protein DJ70_08545 [Halorubrum halodurans]|uniref:Recombinase family protein n=2 Tax=Halorubrum halodurans TaxID=1383851 RepID=A0A256IJC0_9EURY|nr:hypothetical protein DJ70_08545 [Halorubrum halodurans]